MIMDNHQDLRVSWFCIFDNHQSRVTIGYELRQWWWIISLKFK